MKNIWLWYQLRKTGASQNDAQELARIASKISDASVPALSEEARQRLNSRLPVSTDTYSFKHKTFLAFALSAACVVVVVAVAQVAPATSPLYNIKRGTDFIRGLWSSSSSDKNTESTETVEKMQSKDLPTQSELPQVPEEKLEDNEKHQSDRSGELDRPKRRERRDFRKMQRDRDDDNSQRRKQDTLWRDDRR